jgi:hypothetical protein
MASPLPPQPSFNINNAMNTFNQQLGARVASGQMTMDQARAAQAEMTALQRMPNATREQATDVAQRQMQVGQYAPTPVTPPMPQGGLTLSNVPQRLTLSNTPPPMEDIVVQPMRPAPQADTGFNINTAMNTFNQSLGDRVASGQMSLDQARAAQAEMTALQRTANPTRAAATEVAQRNLQVGQYAPQIGYPIPEVREAQPVRPTPVMPPMPMAPTQVMPPIPMATQPEVIGSRMPPPGVRSGDTRIFADQPMALPGGSGYDERGNILRAPQPRNLTDILQRGLMMPSQPVARPQPMPQPMARPMPQPMAQRPTGMLFNNLMNKYRGRAY